MKFGVIGCGSIGQRHIRNLLAASQKDIVLLRKKGRRNEFNLPEFSEDDLFLDTKLDAVIIANPTSLHGSYLSRLLSHDINVLVEKPLVSSIEEWQTIQDQLSSYTGIAMTAYNMRFHPVVKEIHQILNGGEIGKIYSARFFVGQYLPDWRSEADYSKSYSASREMGGGVLFDLIHEIDLACFLIGTPKNRVKSMVSRISDLKIDTEDLVELFYQTEQKTQVTIHLDYITRGYQRYIELIGEKGTLRADLYSNNITIVFGNKKTKSKSFPDFLRNHMYFDMLSVFLNCIKLKIASPISLQEGFISNQISIDIRNEFYNGKNREK